MSRLGYRAEVIDVDSSSWATQGAAPPLLLVVLASAQARRFLSASSAVMSALAPRPPVVVFGELGAEIRDLAELLELGADRLLSAPLQVDELRALLGELLGPASRAEPRSSGGQASWGEVEEAAPVDPMLAQLKRTLASLAPAAEDDEVDLRAMGLTAMAAPGEGAAAAALDLSALEAVTRELVRPSAPPQSTVRLESSVDAAAEQRTAVVEPQTRGRGGRPSRSIAGDEAATRGEEGAATRLWRAHRERFSGLMKLSFEADSLELWMIAGEPRFAASSRAEDDLIVALHARGLLTSWQLAQAQRLGIRGTLIGGEALVSAGWVRPQELAPAMAAQLADVITATFAWPRASALLRVDAPPPGDVALVGGVLGLIVGGIALELEPDELWGRLGARSRRPRWIGAEAAAARFGAGAVEAVVDAATLNLLDGRRSLAAVEEEGFAALASICGLHTIGAVELLEPPSGPELDPAALVRARLSERLALAGVSDDAHHRLLGVAPGARRGAIRRARRALLASFSAPLLEAALVETFAAELAALRAAIDAAAAALLAEPRG